MCWLGELDESGVSASAQLGLGQLDDAVSMSWWFYLVLTVFQVGFFLMKVGTNTNFSRLPSLPAP